MTFGIISDQVVDQGYNYQTPLAGFSITLNDTDWHVILDPAGTLATGTITMNPAPMDGQLIDIRTSQTITAVTLSANAGQSMKGAPTTLAAGTSVTLIYRLTNTTWYAAT